MSERTRTVTAALRPLSTTYRRAVRDELTRRDLPTSGPLNPERRVALEAAIFAVQTELEHRSPAHPQVVAMNAVRNVLLDEVPVVQGGNETHEHLRWPHVEAVAAVMRRRGRQGPPRGWQFLPKRSDVERVRSDDMSSDGPRVVSGQEGAP